MDTRGLVVRAAPGEVNRMSIRSSARGVVIDDLGAALTGACRPASSGGRFCRGSSTVWRWSSATGATGSTSGTSEGRWTAGRVTTRSSWPARLTCSSVAPARDLLDARLAPGSAISTSATPLE